MHFTTLPALQPAQQEPTISAPHSINRGHTAPLGIFSYRTSVVLPFPPLPQPHRRRSERAVVTWVAGDAAYAWFAVTGPAMKRYADRVGADFIVLDGQAGQPYSLINKFRVRQVFDEYGYDVVLYVDADALIRDHAVDFFDVVPDGYVGILDEEPYYDEWALASYRREARALLTSQGYDVDVDIPSPKNSGLFVMPSSRRDVLTPFARPFPLCARGGATVEQTWLSLMLQQHNAPLFDLEFPTHHWMWYADQVESKAAGAMVLHFAGLGDHDGARRRRLAVHADGGSPASESAAVVASRGRSFSTFDRQLILDHPAPAALKMIGTYTIDTHRYGWKVAVKSLSVLSNPRGVAFDGFVEGTFLYFGRESAEAKTIPYREPWFGFVHNPPGTPDWPSIAEARLQNLSRDPLWLESLPHCLGLIALTEYLARWVRAEWGLPCEVLRHPTLVPETVFSMDAFESNPTPTVATIGFWLRRFSSFKALRTEGFIKVRPALMPSWNTEGMQHIRAYERDEVRFSQASRRRSQPVHTIPRLSNSEYDEMLSRSVVFLDLIDASAVNTVIECLVRGTPLLVNRLEPVVEYLGADYPLYFDSLDEAEDKLADPSLIWAAHRHMRSNPVVAQLTPQSFLDGFARTSLYKQALAAPGVLLDQPWPVLNGHRPHAENEGGLQTLSGTTSGPAT